MPEIRAWVERLANPPRGVAVRALAVLVEIESGNRYVFTGTGRGSGLNEHVYGEPEDGAS